MVCDAPPAAGSAVSVTPLAPGLAAVTLVPVRTLIFAFLKTRCSSAETASSSSGTMRGSSSISVTWLPKRLKMDANSTPTAPLPMIAIDFGTVAMWIASSLVMIRLRSISMPGTLRAVDPVATTISLPSTICGAAPSAVTSTLPPPRRRPVPAMRSILFFLNR
jgi:hypothetical protein